MLIGTDVFLSEDTRCRVVPSLGPWSSNTPSASGPGTWAASTCCSCTRGSTAPSSCPRTPLHVRKHVSATITCMQRQSTGNYGNYKTFLFFIIEMKRVAYYLFFILKFIVNTSFIHGGKKSPFSVEID